MVLQAASAEAHADELHSLYLDFHGIAVEPAAMAAESCEQTDV